jgi:hypothetical protein
VAQHALGREIRVGATGFRIVRFPKSRSGIIMELLKVLIKARHLIPRGLTLDFKGCAER